MVYKQIRIGEMPINLILLPTREVAFVVVQSFHGVYCMETDSVPAMFDESGFTIGDNEYSYVTAYNVDELPEMKQWLIEQNLQLN